MKKLIPLALILCLMLCSMSVHAENISRVEDISLYDTKVITVPQPEGEIDEGWVYFNQEFAFTPEEDGTYRMLMRYEEDAGQPYELTLDVPGSYRELENGIEFDAVAGEKYLLCFQYPTHDGRYPEITFYLGTAEAEDIPKTGDADLMIPALLMLSATALVCLLRKKYTV